MDETTARPRRRWLRPGIRAMMLGIVAIAAVLGWFGHGARVQHNAVAAILRPRPGLQVTLYYDWQFGKPRAAWPGLSRLKAKNRGALDPLARPPGPKWLRGALGPDFFETPILLIIRGDGVIDDEFLGHVGRLRGLEDLVIEGKAGPGLTAAGMAQVRSLDRLNGLYAMQVEGSRGFLAGLAGKSDLRKLRLSKAAATDEDMALIGGLTALETLQLDGRNVTDRGFAHVANLKALTFLALPGVRITNLAPVAGLARLDTLSLAPDRPEAVPDPGGPASLEPLRGLTKLTRIALGPTRAGDRGLAVVAALPLLREIRLRGKWITEAGLARLVGSPSLTRLWLADTSVADLGPLGRRLTVLSALFVEGSPLTDAGVEPLERAGRLGTLSLIGTRITDDGLAPLASLSTLRELRVDRAAITDAGLARLAPLRLLSSLSLSEVALTDASVPAIASFPALRRLRLDRSGISPAGVDQLRKALPKARIATDRPPG